MIIGSNCLRVDKRISTGNVYPREVVKKAIDDFNKNMVLSVGMINDPQHLQTRLDMQATTHKIIKAEMRDRSVYVEAELLDTQMGKVAKNLIQKGMRYRLSPIQTGIVGKDRVVQTIHIQRFDLMQEQVYIVPYPEVQGVL